MQASASVCCFRVFLNCYFGHPNKMFRFPNTPSLVMLGRSVRKKRTLYIRGLASFKKPGNSAEPKDFVSVDLAENVETIVNALGTKQPLENLVYVN